MPPRAQTVEKAKYRARTKSTRTIERSSTPFFCMPHARQRPTVEPARWKIAQVFYVRRIALSVKFALKRQCGGYLCGQYHPLLLCKICCRACAAKAGKDAVSKCQSLSRIFDFTVSLRQGETSAAARAYTAKPGRGEALNIPIALAVFTVCPKNQYKRCGFGGGHRQPNAVQTTQQRQQKYRRYL